MPPVVGLFSVMPPIDTALPMRIKLKFLKLLVRVPGRLVVQAPTTPLLTQVLVLTPTEVRMEYGWMLSVPLALVNTSPAANNL